MIIKAGTMKYCFIFLMIFYGTSFNRVSNSEKSDEPLIRGLFSSQQDPFYFLTPVPVTVKLFDKIDLSFFRSRLIVFMYRYRLEIPYGVDTKIDMKLINWSPWLNYDYQEIIVSKLDQEGGYKLIFEYITPATNETKKFEQLFYVYRVNPLTNAANTKSKTARLTDRTPAKTSPVTDRTPAKTIPVTDITATGMAPASDSIATGMAPAADSTATGMAPASDSTATGMIPVTSDTTSQTIVNYVPDTAIINREKESINDKQIDLNDANEEITAEILPPAGNITTEPSKEPGSSEKSIAPDYDKLLAEAIEKKDAALFIESVQNGASCDIKGINGGNIFHIIDEAIANEELISMLNKKGISINEIDDYGDSPLHAAILAGEREYARFLIYQGADLNIKNNLELSPLHYAAFVNDEEVVKHLLSKGAEINIEGNSGYTPLHVVSELNHITVAKVLLLKGANERIKTDQKLTPGDIAKIQNNYEMNKLIGKKGSYNLPLPESTSAKSDIILNSVRHSPKYDFNLIYDNELAKKRQLNKVVRIISIPVFAFSTAGLTYMKSEAEHYYRLSKIAETEEMAKGYYNKTTLYDTYTYITGGISLISVYGFIHSTIRKKSISNNMRKKFN